MDFSSYSSKNIDMLISSDSVYERFKDILSKDTDDLIELKKVAKIIIKEFGLSYNDWDKLIFLLKLAKSCDE